MEQKLIVEQKIRIALHRHSGDILKVADELNIPLDYVFKIARKIRRESIKNPEVNLIIADNLAAEIIAGRNERRQILKDMIASLLNREQMWVCSICNFPVSQVAKTVDNAPKTVFQCDRCQKEVVAKFIDRDAVYERKQSLLRDLLAEDDKLIEWMNKMGYTGTPQQPVVRNTQIIIGDRNVPVEERKVIDSLQNLSPQEAERIIKQIEQATGVPKEFLPETEPEKPISADNSSETTK